MSYLNSSSVDAMQCEFRLNCCMLVSTWPYLFRVRDCYFCIFLTLLAPWVTKHTLLLVGTIVNIGFHWLRVPSLNTQLMLLFSWSIFGDYNPSFFPRYLHSFNLYLYSSRIVIMIKWKWEWNEKWNLHKFALLLNIGAQVTESQVKSDFHRLSLHCIRDAVKSLFFF